MKIRQRPHLWKSGPDPILRARRLAFIRAECQARFRGEDWKLTLLQWEELWQLDLWNQRGRAQRNLILTRKNIAGAWELRNVEITTRRGNMSRHYRYYHKHRKVDRIPKV